MMWRGHAPAAARQKGLIFFVLRKDRLRRFWQVKGGARESDGSVQSWFAQPDRVDFIAGDSTLV
jgi:hypothetical protein